MTCITLKFRLKDKHRRHLNRQAKSVNQVWNFCNETQQKAFRLRNSGQNTPWTDKYQLQRLTAGSYEDLGLPASSIQMVCHEYDKSRRQQKKPWLRWRTDKSLGWIPINSQKIKFENFSFNFMGTIFYPMHYRHKLLDENTKIKCSSFNEDSRGRWYINIVVEINNKINNQKRNAVGIDLGLKNFAVASNGEEFKSNQYYRKTEKRIALLQRAGKKSQARKLHAKIANQRRDSHHKATSYLIKRYGQIYVGDVNAKKLAQTKMAKSVNDAAWSMFRNMLRYKSIMNGVTYLEVNEQYTTQTCSSCGVISASSPKGIEGLRIREWTCAECNTTHNRDVNAAKNILRLGLQTHVGGASYLR